MFKNIITLILLVFFCTNVFALPKCPGERRIPGKWKNCTGSYKALDGHKYSGDFDSNGLYTGYGVLEKKGYKYEGNFFKDKFHGQGKSTTNVESGLSYYEGDWFMGSWHGKGKLWSDDGVFSYEGEFQNFEMTGYGTVTFRGKTQTGNWKNGELVK